MSSRNFDGKVAIITGSSGGIGKTIAIEFAQRGAFVVLNGRNSVRLTATENEIRMIQPKIHSVCCDVSTIEGGQLLVDETIKVFGRIDILVNNAGISMRGNFADLNPEVFKTVFDTNVLGSVYPTIPAIKYLRHTKGSIVFISSLAGIRGLPFTSAYCSSKMALRALAESIRLEEAQYKLHVGLILVGVTEIDEGKEIIWADGSKLKLNARLGKGVQTKQSVSNAVVRNIQKRKFITVLTTVGKLNAFLQALFPCLVERILLMNLNKFDEKLK
jgi:NAD(P)-dependent dehydrogenase (short-subunit alcohol dehydrogenase family)